MEFQMDVHARAFVALVLGGKMSLVGMTGSAIDERQSQQSPVSSSHA